MKYIILLFAALLIGCVESHPVKPYEYELGEKVRIKVGGQMGIVRGRFHAMNNDNKYDVGWFRSDTQGQSIEYDGLYYYELEPWEETPESESEQGN